MTRMYESPIRPRRRQTSRFRGDQFLRLTPQEAGLIAHVEAVYRYDPYQPGAMPVLASPAPPAPPAGGNDRGDSFWRYLLRELAAILLEWAEG